VLSLFWLFAPTLYSTSNLFSSCPFNLQEEIKILKTSVFTNPYTELEEEEEAKAKAESVAAASAEDNVSQGVRVGDYKVHMLRF
jgi:hypothetical protein